MKWLAVKNWNHWQTYRKDRDPPPWIKVHRRVLYDMEWSMLSDAEKGQLVSIWILAADKGGLVPNDSATLQRILGLTDAPNIGNFIELGLLSPTDRQSDAKVTSIRRQADDGAAST